MYISVNRHSYLQHIFNLHICLLVSMSIYVSISVIESKLIPTSEPASAFIAASCVCKPYLYASRPVYKSMFVSTCLDPYLYLYLHRRLHPYLHLSLCLYLYIYIQIYIYICNRFACISVLTPVAVCIQYVYVYTYGRLFILYTRIHVCTTACVCVYICIYIYIYAYKDGFVSSAGGENFLSGVETNPVVLDVPRLVSAQHGRSPHFRHSGFRVGEAPTQCQSGSTAVVSIMACGHCY